MRLVSLRTVGLQQLVPHVFILSVEQAFCTLEGFLASVFVQRHNILKPITSWFCQARIQNIHSFYVTKWLIVVIDWNDDGDVSPPPMLYDQSEQHAGSLMFF